MDDSDNKIISGREQTDESLREERKKTDTALVDTIKTIEKKADIVVEKARDKVDIIVEEARDKADEKLASLSASAETTHAILKKREKDDEVVQKERIAADELLARQRKEDTLALKRLFPLEREKTDRTLLIERARADDALEHRDDFLGMVSHDLKDLLGGILLSSTLLTQRATQSEEGKRIRETGINIERYVARMNRLIGDLVDIQSIDAGKLSVSLGVVDTTQLITEAVETFQPLAKEKNISLESVLSGDFPVLPGDHERMLQVFANLITNALKFTPEGGSIIIRREKTKDTVTFSATDTGQGMQKNVLEVIFERFWQVDKNSRRGLGLGLYISRCIVEAHGGKIWAESTAGKGSQFFFTLPLVAATQTHKAL